MAANATPLQSGDLDAGPPFVFGFCFKGGTSAEMRWEEAVAGPEDYDFIWLHLNANNEETRRWIRTAHDLPYAAANALLADETRPRVTSFENGLVVNLRGVNLNEGADPEDMVSIRIWLDKKRIISTRRRRLKAAQDIRQEIIGGAKIESPGALVARIAARLTERMEPHVLQIDDTVDALEQAILGNDGHGLRARLAETRLASDDTGLFDGFAKVELRETADKVTRLTEEIDAARERAMVLQDQLTDQRAEELNRNMMILSVVAAIFLPLGFLTGLLGINVGGMPGADNPMAFWIVVALCFALGGALVAYFHQRGWL